VIARWRGGGTTEPPEAAPVDFSDEVIRNKRNTETVKSRPACWWRRA
jgi:hypothetical protein